MNLLTDKPPDFIWVGGRKLKIKTEFSLWVKFLIAAKNNDTEALTEILLLNFPELPAGICANDLIAPLSDWLWQCEKHTSGTKEAGAGSAFDFEEDGNVIYCELWEHYPNLMQRGISFPEGMELVKLLIANDKTALHHRAFARVGDFSKMDREQKKYWQRERAKYALKMSQKSIDDVFSRGF